MNLISDLEIHYTEDIDMERKNGHREAYELIVKGVSQGFFQSKKDLFKYIDEAFLRV